MFARLPANENSNVTLGFTRFTHGRRRPGFRGWAASAPASREDGRQKYQTEIIYQIVKTLVRIILTFLSCSHPVTDFSQDGSVAAILRNRDMAEHLS
jgi:hypothetical protein